MKKDRTSSPAGATRATTFSASFEPFASSPATSTPAPTPTSAPTPAQTLRRALAAVGLDDDVATAFCDAAQVLGATRTRVSLADLELESAGPSAQAGDRLGTRPGDGAAPGSVEAQLHRADAALAAAEAITSCQMRLDAALVVATAQQAVGVGAALLAAKDVIDPGELSPTARKRWSGTTRRRTVAEIVPAIGWTSGESAHLVALATAPAAVSGPVVAQMGRGQLPWRLARGLWRACCEAGLDPADAAHLAQVMCADDVDSCVPERLEPDGTVTTSPWGHRAFWVALDREVAKLTHADDLDPEDAAAAKAARDAAYAARSVLARAGEEGMGSLTLLLPNVWVAAIKDRLVGAAAAARAAGDERTRDQLEADISRVLLAHAALGYADLPLPQADDGQSTTAEDLSRAGWTP